MSADEPFAGDPPVPSLTEEVVVACSFCGAHVTLPFRCGAVLPSNDEPSVYAWIPTLSGGEHYCPHPRAEIGRRYAPKADVA